MKEEKEENILGGWKKKNKRRILFWIILFNFHDYKIQNSF